jgi:hypothetical protein
LQIYDLHPVCKASRIAEFGPAKRHSKGHKQEEEEVKKERSNCFPLYPPEGEGEERGQEVLGFQPANSQPTTTQLTVNVTSTTAQRDVDSLPILSLPILSLPILSLPKETTTPLPPDGGTGEGHEDSMTCRMVSLNPKTKKSTRPSDAQESTETGLESICSPWLVWW